MITETSSGPGESIEVDVFHWDKQKYLTVIDLFMRLGSH